MRKHSLPRKQVCEKEKHRQEGIATHDITHSHFIIARLDRSKSSGKVWQRGCKSQCGSAEDYSTQSKMLREKVAALLEYDSGYQSDNRCHDEDNDDKGKTHILDMRCPCRT